MSVKRTISLIVVPMEQHAQQPMSIIALRLNAQAVELARQQPALMGSTLTTVLASKINKAEVTKSPNPLIH